jgi:lycopene beta-cyclase
MTSVLVVGGGPAGRALAAECAARGSETILVDRAPTSPWRATYGAWLDELPPGLPPPAVIAEGRVIARTAHELERRYAVLDVSALRAHLDERLAAGGVRVVAGRVTGRSGSTVLLSDGTRLHADAIVDAGGHRAPLLDADPTASTGRRKSGPAAGADPTEHADRPRQGAAAAADPPEHAERRQSAAVAAEQTAYGVVVDADLAAALVEPGTALFMDWRPDHGEQGWPTFLYAVPLGGGATLLEETSLARRPGLPLPVLRRRLLARLAHHGIDPPEDAPIERVRFPVDRPRHTTPGVLGFGAAAPLMHPATGFSVAEALRMAPDVAEVLLSDGLPAAQRLVWSTRAQAVHRLRRIGLEAMLRMPPESVPDFFETFFTLPQRHQRAYLSARDDLPGLLAAMGALFVRADSRLRCRLVGPAVRRPAPALPTFD